MKAIPVLVSVALAAGTATVASAGNLAVTEGSLRTREGANVVPVPLEHTEVKVRVDGFIAEVDVDQRFKNPYSYKIEAVYLFPLPAQSAVNGYELATGGRTIKGEIKLKDDAKAIYKAAKTKGYVAGLLTQERPNLFTQAVANIEPGATVDVRLHYVQALGYDSGAYELVFPMVAGPRYVPKTSKVDAAAVQPAVLPAGMRSGHDIGVTVEVDAGVPIGNVRSPSHTIAMTKVSAHEARVALGAGDTVPNKDFILRYDVAGAKPEFAVVTNKAAGAPGSFFFMAQPPVKPDAAQITPKEMVFVIDTSSSMQGRPLDKAKEAITRALKGMHPDDTFQIIRFDDSASALGGRPIANKPKNVEKALAWLGQLQAGGGTDMTGGIKAALAFPHDPARLRIVMFLTDGFIGNEDEILAIVQDKLGPSRLFSFGVGSAVNRYLLEEMAAIGRGAVQVVRPDEDTTAAVERMHARIASPLLTDITIDWKGLAVQDASPGKIPDLFAGQPLVLSGRYAKGGSATVTITGMQAGRKVSFDVPVALPELRDRPAIAAIWARSKIAELTRQQLKAEKPAVKQQIVDLAMTNHLMSTYTAFVAVDTSKTTAGGAAQTVAVPVEVSEGLRSTTADFGGSGGGAIYGLEGGVAGGTVSHSYAGPSGKISVADRAEAIKIDEESLNNPLADGKAKGGGDPAPSPPPPPQQAQAEPKREPAKPTQPTETSNVAMRGDIDRCFAAKKGSVKVSVAFDASGNPTTVDVGGDADISACVRSAAKKWRASANRTVNLAVTK